MPKKVSSLQIKIKSNVVYSIGIKSSFGQTSNNQQGNSHPDSKSSETKTLLGKRCRHLIVWGDTDAKLLQCPHKRHRVHHQPQRERASSLPSRQPHPSPPRPSHFSHSPTHCPLLHCHHPSGQDWAEIQWTLAFFRAAFQVTFQAVLCLIE